MDLKAIMLRAMDTVYVTDLGEDEKQCENMFPIRQKYLEYSSIKLKLNRKTSSL